MRWSSYDSVFDTFAGAHEYETGHETSPFVVPSSAGFVARCGVNAVVEAVGGGCWWTLVEASARWLVQLYLSVRSYTVTPPLTTHA